MGGQDTSQKDATKSLEQASAIQAQIAQGQLNDPLFAQRNAITQDIVNNPFTFGPDQRAALFAQQAAVANESANDFLTNSLASATGPSGAGARSGSVVNDRILAASGLGQALSQARQQVDLTGAQQDRSDLLTSLGTIDAQLQANAAPQQAQVQTALGQGQILGGFRPEQSGPLGAVGGILGSATGGLLGNDKLIK